MRSITCASSIRFDVLELLRDLAQRGDESLVIQNRSLA